MTPLAHLKVNKMKAKSIINQYKHTNDYFFDYFFLLHCMRQLTILATESQGHIHICKLPL